MRTTAARLISAAAAAALCASLACGCAAPAQQDGSAPLQEQGQASESQTGEPTDNAQSSPAESVTGGLRFLDTTSDDVLSKYYQDVFAEFTAQTGIAVSYESIPGEFARDKLILLNTVAQMPDIVITRAGWLKELVSNDCLISLAKYASPVLYDFSDVVTKAVWRREREQLEGIYSVPYALRVQCVYYRKDWAERIIKSDRMIEQEALLSNDEDALKRKEELDKLPKFTLSQQWTYDDLLALIRRTTNRVSKRYGLALVGNEGAFDYFNDFMQNFSDGYTFDASDVCVYNSNPMIQAMTLYCGLVSDGCVPADAYNWNKREALNSFLSGMTAVYVGDSSDLTQIMNQMEASELGVLPMPLNTVTGKRLNDITAPFSYSITSDCQRPEDAWKLIDYLTGPAVNVPFCKQHDLLPVRKTLEFDLDYSDGGKYYPFISQLSDPQLLIPQTVPELDSFDQIRSELWKYINGISDEVMTMSNVSQLLTHSLNAFLSENPLYRLNTPAALS